MIVTTKFRYLAFATVGLGVATVGLYLIGKRQIRLAREEFVSTHRPRLIVRQVMSNHPIKFWISVVNVGDTTAPFHPPVADNRCDALRQVFDEVVAIGRDDRRMDVDIGGVRSTIADVLHDRARLMSF